MFQDIKDEILSGDPRYTIQDNNGRIIEDDVQITLKTPVTQEGTPLNRNTFRNLQGDLYTVDRYNKPSYSGSVMTLNLPLTSYETGKVIKIKAPATISSPMLNVNGLGNKTVSGSIKLNQYYDLVYDGSKFIVGRTSIGFSREPIIITSSGTYTINADVTYKVVLVGGGGGSAFYSYNTTKAGAGGAGGYAEGIYVPTSGTVSVEIGKGGANDDTYSYGNTAQAEDGGTTIVGFFKATGGKGAYAGNSATSETVGGTGEGYFSQQGATGVLSDKYANETDNGWELEGTKYGGGGYIYYPSSSISFERDGKDGVVIFYPLC